MTKRVMIIGGGIAGPVTAIALQRAGLDPVIYEAYESGADGTGAFLTLAVNGMAALGVLGLEDLVAGLGMDSPVMTMTSARGTGKQLATLPLHGRTVPRTDLYATLRDEAVRRGIPLEYGKRLSDATITGGPGAGGVRAVFADGTTADGDLLVGADGLRSRTRTIIDPAAPAARHIGLLNTGGYAHGLQLPGQRGAGQFVFGRRCFFGYFIHPDSSVWWFANPPSRTEPSREELLAISQDQWRARLVDLFRDDAGPMLDIIAATDRIWPSWNTYDFPRVPHWHNERMVLVGDAVHATSPSSGQGASLAVEDGLVLARCLRDIADPAAAFARFKQLRQQRVEKVVQHGKRSGSGKAAGPVTAYLRDLMLPVVMRKLATSHSLDWMYDYRIDWNEPADLPR